MAGYETFQLTWKKTGRSRCLLFYNLSTYNVKNESIGAHKNGTSFPLNILNCIQMMTLCFIVLVIWKAFLISSMKAIVEKHNITAERKMLEIFFLKGVYL